MWYDDEDEDNEEEGCCSSSASVTPHASPSESAGCYSGMALCLRSSCVDLPINLYMAAPGLIGMGSPTCADHIRNLHAQHNVAMVINLRESANCDDWFEGLPVRSVHLPIPSYCAPSVETMMAVLGLLKLAHSERMTVAVHCREGKGRTGTICAGYLLHKHRDLAADEAVALIRSRSPLSIESKEQEDFLHRFACLCQEGGIAVIQTEDKGRVVEGRLATSTATRCRLSYSSRVLARMDSASDDDGNWYCS